MTKSEAIARCMEYELERDALVARINELEGEQLQARARLSELENGGDREKLSGSQP